MKVLLLFFTLFDLATLQAGEAQEPITTAQKAATIVQSQQRFTALLQSLAEEYDTEIRENIVTSGSVKSMQPCGKYQAFPDQLADSRTPSPDRNTPSPATQKLIEKLQKEYEQLRKTQTEFKAIKKTEDK